MATGDPYAAGQMLSTRANLFPPARTLSLCIATGLCRSPCSPCPTTARRTVHSIACANPSHPPPIPLCATTGRRDLQRSYPVRSRLPRAPTQLTQLEQTYCHEKLGRATCFYSAGMNYDLLLELIGMVEDAETLTTRGQDELVATHFSARPPARVAGVGTICGI